MMKHNRRLAVAVLLIAAVLLTLGLSSCRKQPTDPLKYLAKAVENTVGSLDLESPLPDLGDTLQADLIWKGTTDTEMLGIENLQLKAYASPVAGALELDASLMGADLDLKLYGNSTKLALQSGLLGDTVYGTDLSKLEENYASSIFGNPEGPLYLGDLSEILPELPAVSAPTVDAEALIEKYVGLLTEAIKTNTEASLQNREEGGKTVTVTFGSEGVKALLRAVYNTAKTDADLRKLVTSVVNDEEILAAYDAFFASEETLNQVLTAIDEEAVTMTLTVLTDKDDRIVNASLAAKVSSSQSKAEVQINLTQKDTVILSLQVEQVEDGETYRQGGSLIVEQSAVVDGTETTVITLEMWENDGMKVTMELLDCSYQPQTGAFMLTIGRGIPDMDTITVKGTLTVSKTSLSVAISELVMQEMSLKVDVTIAVKAIDAVPAVPAYTEIFTLTEDQIASLGETVMEHPLFALFMGQGDDMMGGIEGDVMGDIEFTEDMFFPEDTVFDGDLVFPDM